MNEKERKLNELDQKLGPKTRADFEQYSKNIAAKAFIKLLKIYDDDRSLSRSKKALKAVKLFNPMVLKSEPPIMVLEDMVDDLRYFGIDDFDDQEFLNKIKNDLPEAIRISKLDFDWDSISESKSYVQRVKRRKRRHKLMALVAEVKRREAGSQERVNAEVD